MRMRYRNLKGYWPLTGNASLEPDWTSQANALTAFGSPVKASLNAPVTPYNQRLWSLGEIMPVDAVMYHKT